MEDQEQKHICKFCQKTFPCGRSLGGHMRSHLINVSSSDHHQKTDDQKLPKKKLPPLVNGKKTDFSENSKKANKSLKSSEQDTLLQEKPCKECGKSFQSWKALFGHMKCHSVNGKISNSVEEDSWYSSNDQSDNGTTTPLRRRRRSNRTKRYTITTNSSSLTVSNFSPSVSDIDDQQEQEEVALSLIILSGDKGNWGGTINSVVESSDNNSSEFLEANKISKTLDKDSKSECLKLKNSRNELKTRKLEVSTDDFRVEDKFETKNLDIEVNSPKILIKGSGFSHFETESKKKKNKPRKRKLLAYGPCDYEEFEKNSKFTCSVCKKAFSSYQALGGHRASHKKFKGCCAPSENSLETENSHNQNANYSSENVFAGWKKNKVHECPICFKVFPSGQALGGHKRSHLIADHQAKNDPSVFEKRKPVRDFLDLNLPAPDEEEECSDFKAWWFGTSRKAEPLLSLLSG
ncbi:hypothetical protein DH2020_013100 [Rehmannia glutinosa]|uniref:C2H2-type domain-containing protein n=1 Tax=Rehmannia glutinosa TaxID=99300 RepID=A0ABR0X2P1_REHGL